MSCHNVDEEEKNKHEMCFKITSCKMLHQISHLDLIKLKRTL